MNDNKEVLEAVNAANDALYHLANAEEILRSAKRWGIADILGGGMIITGIKHAKADNASTELRLADQAIEKLERELRDLQGMVHINTEIHSGLLTMGDFLFDNLWTDIMSQNRMNQAYREVQDAIAQIEGILDTLEDYVM